MLNPADSGTRDNKNPVWYCQQVTLKGDKMNDLLKDIKASNTTLTVENGELKYLMRSTDDLKDFLYWDESKR